jgi:hypothetical protein
LISSSNALAANADPSSMVEGRIIAWRSVGQYTRPMPRDTRPWLVLLLSGGFLLIILVTVGPLAVGRLRPTELQPASPVACPTCPAGQAILADAGSPTVSPEVVEVHDLATLTRAAAKRLDGRRSLFRVIIDGLPVHLGPGDSWEVLPRGNPQGTLFVRIGPPEGRGEVRELTVEATLTVIHHPVHVAGAVVTPAFVEYRLMDADWVGP